MKMLGLAVLAALFSSPVPVAAQNSSISTEPPLPKTKVAPALHKPKPVAHAAKQLVTDSEQNKAAPHTIPMDFSGMARRPADLKSESNPALRPDTGDQSVPHFGASRDGGFSPGMKIGF